jgi:hypothetical protein
MRKEITVKSIAALERAGGRITDTKIRGFVARCLPSGKIQFGYQYGSRAARRWINIGLLGEVNDHINAARALIFPPGGRSGELARGGQHQCKAKTADRTSPPGGSEWRLLSRKYLCRKWRFVRE